MSGPLSGCAVLLLLDADNARTHEDAERCRSAGARVSVRGERPVRADELTHIVADSWDAAQRLTPSLAYRHSRGWAAPPPRPGGQEASLVFVRPTWLEATLAAGRRAPEGPHAFTATRGAVAAAAAPVMVVGGGHRESADEVMARRMQEEWIREEAGGRGGAAAAGGYADDAMAPAAPAGDDGTRRTYVVVLIADEDSACQDALRVCADSCHPSVHGECFQRDGYRHYTLLHLKKLTLAEARRVTFDSSRAPLPCSLPFQGIHHVMAGAVCLAPTAESERTLEGLRGAIGGIAGVSTTSPKLHYSLYRARNENKPAEMELAEFKRQRKISFDAIKGACRTQHVAFGYVTGTHVVIRAIDDGTANAAATERVIAGAPDTGRGGGSGAGASRRGGGRGADGRGGGAAAKRPAPAAKGQQPQPKVRRTEQHHRAAAAAAPPTAPSEPHTAAAAPQRRCIYLVGDQNLCTLERFPSASSVGALLQV